MSKEPECPGHIEGKGWEGQGRTHMEKVTCSCGWQILSDQAYFGNWRRQRWMEHAVDVLLREVADLRSQMAHFVNERRCPDCGSTEHYPKGDAPCDAVRTGSPRS